MIAANQIDTHTKVSVHIFSNLLVINSGRFSIIAFTSSLLSFSTKGPPDFTKKHSCGMVHFMAFLTLFLPFGLYTACQSGSACGQSMLIDSTPSEANSPFPSSKLYFDPWLRLFFNSAGVRFGSMGGGGIPLSSICFLVINHEQLATITKRHHVFGATCM